MNLWDKLTTTNHKTPAYRLLVTTKDEEKKDITPILFKNLISLNLTDNRGFEADELEVQLSDEKGEINLPKRGVVVELAIGWQGEQLIEKGKFTVDELQYSGSPDSITLRARSADLRGSLSSKQERSFHNIKLGDLIKQLALENQLEPCCAKQWQDKLITHLDQTNESAVNLLSRLAEEYDAIATVKNSKLIFMPAGKGQSISGKPLPPIKLTKQTGDNYQFSITEGENYTAVKAYWHNLDTGKKGEVIIDENTEVQCQSKMTKEHTQKDGTVTGSKESQRKYNVVEHHQPIETDADKMKTLRHTYQNETNALKAAKSAFAKMKRGVATFSINLATGNAELMPELPVTVSGFKPMIDSTDWIISKVTHSISSSGFTTAIECELGGKKEYFGMKKEEK